MWREIRMHYPCKAFGLMFFNEGINDDFANISHTWEGPDVHHSFRERFFFSHPMDFGTIHSSSPSVSSIEGRLLAQSPDSTPFL
jgi:hypothetical protein